MSMDFFYVSLALVPQNNSNGSVLALLGKKINPQTFMEEKGTSV